MYMSSRNTLYSVFFSVQVIVYELAYSMAVHASPQMVLHDLKSFRITHGTAPHTSLQPLRHYTKDKNDTTVRTTAANCLK